MSLLVPDSGLLFWMVLSFGIVLFVLVRYGFPTILKSVERRQEYIEQSLESAKEAELRLASTELDAKAIIEKANKERAVILANAEQTATKIVDNAKGSAKEEAKQIVSRAGNEAEELKRRAVSEISQQIVGISVRIAEKVVGEQLNDKESQLKYINRLLQEEIKAEA